MHHLLVEEEKKTFRVWKSLTAYEVGAAAGGCAGKSRGYLLGHRASVKPQSSRADRMDVG